MLDEARRNWSGRRFLRLSETLRPPQIPNFSLAPTAAHFSRTGQTTQSRSAVFELSPRSGCHSETSISRQSNSPRFDRRGPDTSFAERVALCGQQWTLCCPHSRKEVGRCYPPCKACWRTAVTVTVPLSITRVPSTTVTSTSALSAINALRPKLDGLKQSMFVVMPSESGR